LELLNMIDSIPILIWLSDFSYCLLSLKGQKVKQTHRWLYD